MMILAKRARIIHLLLDGSLKSYEPRYKNFNAKNKKRMNGKPPRISFCDSDQANEYEVSYISKLRIIVGILPRFLRLFLWGILTNSVYSGVSH